MQAGRGADPREGLGAFSFGDFASLDPFRQIPLDGREASINCGGINIAQHDLESGGGGDLRDAMTHGAGAQHSNGANRGRRSGHFCFVRVCVQLIRKIAETFGGTVSGQGPAWFD